MRCENNENDGSRFDDASSAFTRLFSIVKTLRGEKGCPWDKKQTPQSMRPCIVEECFETVDAITKEDSENSKEELGDLFFNVLLTGYMFEQKNDFSVPEIFNAVSEKLLRRHPHVDFDESLFSESRKENPVKIESADEVNAQWNKIKNTVEGRDSGCILSQVPDGFPPMLKAYKYLKKAASTGFEWPDISDAKSKILEELEEVCEAQNESDCLHLEEEAGDLLLSVINYVRLLGINPDVALERASKKFFDRYSYVEKKMNEENIPKDSSSLDKMEEFWKQAKSKGL